jgi:hypothetical protein
VALAAALLAHQRRQMAFIIPSHKAESRWKRVGRTEGLRR